MHRFSKTQFLQVKLINKGIDKPNGVIGGLLVIQYGEIGLITIGSGYKIHAKPIAKSVLFLGEPAL
jgi:hypothetical protein